METLAKLLLLTACCHLSVVARSSRCESMTKWYGGMILDLEGNENATISVITLFYTNSRHECSKICCDSDDCTVASFEANRNLTCQHYSCEPVSECRLTSSAQLGVFTFLTDTGHLTTTTTNTTTTSPAANRTETLHGDGGHSKPRKGAQPDEPLLDEEPLKHDNTSVKPRKGVVDDPLASSLAPEVNLTSVDMVVVLEEENNSSTPIQDMGTSSVAFVDSSSIPLSSSVSPKTEVVVATARVQVQTSTDKLSTSTIEAVVAEVSELGSVGKSEVEWQRELSASNLHLVIALVMGLMLLFAVLGVIAKRVYDQWQRRHYSRMDFLIDGMYHGNG